MRVVILEDGERFTTDDFNARPRDMSAKLYRDAAQTATLGNVPVVLPLGNGVGGTTTINSGTCFRTPPAVLEMWAERFGLDALGEHELEPYYRRVERIVNVAQVPPELAGQNAEVVRRGAEALGWHGDYIFRNVRGCVGSGVCNWGCPTSAKQHVGITYMPKAWAAGAVTYTATRARRIEVAGGRARAVEAGAAAQGGARRRGHLHRPPGGAHRGGRRPGARGRGGHRGGRARARRVRHRDRRVRRDLHAAAAAPPGPGRRLRAARPQPHAAPGDRG